MQSDEECAGMAPKLRLGRHAPSRVAPPFRHSIRMFRECLPSHAALGDRTATSAGTRIGCLTVPIFPGEYIAARTLADRTHGGAARRP